MTWKHIQYYINGMCSRENSIQEEDNLKMETFNDKIEIKSAALRVCHDSTFQWLHIIVTE